MVLNKMKFQYCIITITTLYTAHGYEIKCAVFVSVFVYRMHIT